MGAGLALLVLAAGVVMVAARVGVVPASGPQPRTHGAPGPLYPSDAATGPPSTDEAGIAPSSAGAATPARDPASAFRSPATATGDRAPPSSTQAAAAVAVAVAFADAEWTSDGTGGLRASADRTVPWASPRLRSSWATAPDPPAPPGRPGTARVLDASIVDSRAAPVVVQVDVERVWTDGRAPLVDSVPHVMLLTMAQGDSGWTVDDVAAVS